MSFLQPWVLAALPAMLLPIVIHLINRQRHRSVPWAAMMFLVSAKRMHKGMARLRYVLILLLRMLAIGLLVFAVSRPLSVGRLGGAGLSRPDATIVLLDRSASMEAQDLQTGDSRRSTALRKLSGLLEQRGFGSQLVLIDSATGGPLVLEEPSDLLDVPQVAPTATSADVPALLEAALAVLDANQAGRADVWICSDLAENDWKPNGGRWASLRQAFAERQGVQLQLLSYSGAPADNVAVRVRNVRRREIGARAELVLDVQLSTDGAATDSSAAARVVPVEFEIDGLRSTVELTLQPTPEGRGASLAGHRIGIDSDQRAGFGVVRIPGDANPLDNTFYFAFGEPPVRRAVIVTDDSGAGEALRRALAVPSIPGAEHEVEVLDQGAAAELTSAEFERTGIVVWHAPLPDGALAAELEELVAAGRVVLFLPPGTDSSRADSGRAGADLFGSRWGDWRDLEGDARTLSTWRGDADLLAHVESGDALPLNELRTYRHRAIEGAQGLALARLAGGAPLLVRAPSDHGAAYFLGTLPTASSSTLQRDAVAFYVLMQRALERGSRALAPVAQVDAGEEALVDAAAWEVVAPADDAPARSQRGLVAGVYRRGKRLAAVNRSLAEDRAAPVAPAAVDALFEGLAFQRIEDEVGDGASLASEVWRLFLIVMALALIGEALLCLPRREASS